MFIKKSLFLPTFPILQVLLHKPTTTLSETPVSIVKAEREAVLTVTDGVVYGNAIIFNITCSIVCIYCYILSLVQPGW